MVQGQEQDEERRPWDSRAPGPQQALPWQQQEHGPCVSLASPPVALVRVPSTGSEERGPGPSGQPVEHRAGGPEKRGEVPSGQAQSI